jgi:predicted metal-dependent phosphoesterase TrpH
MRSYPQRWAVDFHAHTNFSKDCALSPLCVIKTARLRGLNGIAITDHDTEEGGLATLEMNPYKDFLVIPGVEIKTDLGDLIGLYIKHPIKSRRFFDVADEILAQGGVTYVPHPLRTFLNPEEFYGTFSGADAWELFNGRYTSAEMDRSISFFEGRGAAFLSGSDSHFSWDIGVCRTELPARPETAEQLRACLPDSVSVVRPRGEFSRKMGIYGGAMVKAAKTGKYGWMVGQVASVPWKSVRYGVRLLGSRRSGQ